MDSELRILVLDDEPPIRKGICTLITHKLPSVHIVGQGSNGLEGLELYRSTQPNLIITDIVMPEMTGLEFLREVRKADLHTPCIVISGYDEFSYAREAIRLGATDYLLKPISSTELIRAIIKATDSAHEAKHTDYEELRSSASTLFLHRLLNGELVEIEKVLQACKTLEISLQEGAVTVITLASPNAEEITRALQWAQTRAVTVTQRGPHGVLFIQGSATRADHLAADILSLNLPALRVGIGQPVTTLSSVHISFESALQALTYQAYYPHERLFTQEMIDRSTPYLDSTDIDTLRLKEILLLGDEDELVTWFNTFFSSLFYIKTPPLSYLKGMCIYLLTTVHKHLGEDLGITKSYFDRVAPFNASTVVSIDDLYNEVLNHLVVLNNKVIVQAIADSDIVIHQAKQYVENHLTEIISSTEIAEILKMSPTYFSTYFKTKTGQTFRSYVNSRRNEYAKSLLANITMSIEEISEQLGYTDYRSFHRIFKRMNSITPSEYRKRITKR